MWKFDFNKCTIYCFAAFVVFCSCVWSRTSSVNTESRPLLLGGDVSMLTKAEESGVRFSENETKKDFLDIVKNAGWNCLRLRLFVEPNGRGGVVNDLPYTIALAKRIRSAGFKILLDFHYSDTWADPGKQTKPASWSNLSLAELEKQIESYTSNVIAEMKSAKVLPDMVQIGNEIDPGFLWPEGKLDGQNPARQWRQFASLLKAGIRGVRKSLDNKNAVKIIIHISCGGDADKTKYFFNALNEQKVPFDIIGLSYYPWWHGELADLQNNLRQTAALFGKDIFVVETAYPYCDPRQWEDKKKMNWPITPQGQRDFLCDVVNAVQNTPNGHGLGVLYWYPESVAVKGQRIWNDGSTALFDQTGESLPGLKALSQPSKR